MDKNGRMIMRRLPEAPKSIEQLSNHQRRFYEIQRAIGHPDAEEQIELNTRGRQGGLDDLVSELNIALIDKTDCAFGELMPGKKVTARVFAPYETVFGGYNDSIIEYSMSVIVLDLLSRYGYTRGGVRKVADVLLFVGGNCTFGALVDRDNIQWFRLDVVGNGGAEGAAHRELHLISPCSSSDLASQLDEELDKFIASRHSSQ